MKTIRSILAEQIAAKLEGKLFPTTEIAINNYHDVGRGGFYRIISEHPGEKASVELFDIYDDKVLVFGDDFMNNDTRPYCSADSADPSFNPEEFSNELADEMIKSFAKWYPK